MKERLTSALKVALMLGVCVTGITLLYIHEGNANTPDYRAAPQLDSIALSPCFYNKPAKEGLKEALEFYGIEHPDIVYAQAVLETGYFRSEGCIKHHNLFGLYDSKNRRYHRFEHWTESVIAYKEWIQRRYKPPEDYYGFLRRIHYASDPLYISKLKQIVKKEHDKRRYKEGDSIP